MSRGVHVGRLFFPTKKVLLEACRDLLSCYEPGDFVVDTEHAQFLRDLLDRHPERDQKVGCGLEAFFVDVAHPHRTNCFWIRRVDGTTTDFSFVQCVRPPTPEQDARDALRAEVRDQVDAFRRSRFCSSSPVRCEITGAVLSHDTCHVDHESPKFRELVDQFAASEGRALSDFATSPTADGVTTETLVDRALAARWKNFHAERAKLRLVTVEANLTRPR
jgi:hypothetical protein